MKTFQIAIVFLPFTAFLAQAGPITYDDVGTFQLQQTGNAITGEFKLTQTDSTNTYELLQSSTDQAIGTFQLTNTTGLQDTGNQITGDFTLDQTSTDQFELLETESNTTLTTDIGSLTVNQAGSSIIGQFVLGAPDPSTPEPGTFVLAAVGVAFLACGRLARRKPQKALAAR